MRRTISSTGLVLAVVAALTGCVSITIPPPGPSSSAEPSAPPSASPSGPSESFTAGAPDGQCLTANLSASLEAEPSSLGHGHWSVILTNDGAPCVLDGFPTIQVTSNGTPLGAASEDDSGVPHSPASLATGGSAVASLSAVNIDPGGGPLGDACTVDHGDAVAVTPPHATIAIPVPMADFPACSNGTAWMTVGPVTNG
jgi:hypothetical protein